MTRDQYLVTKYTLMRTAHVGNKDGDDERSGDHLLELIMDSDYPFHVSWVIGY